MGIKDLWTILQPYCERRPLFELQNKRVAVDLSGWVCQAQCVTDNIVQPKMYLRNLYFRTCFLLLSDVHLVYVLEGAAPTLKYKTIAARNELRAKTAVGGATSQRKDKEAPKATKGRSRFDFTLKQCKEMLRTMGLACVTGRGEAEAMCAYLNQKQLVDGCISQDSDCFAYGARLVYRNFSISMQGTQASSGGSIDVYDLNKIESEMEFGRNKIIALALLCGSDYNEGVQGVGKESALKYFTTVADRDVLNKLRAWRTDATHFNRLNDQLSDKNKCSACSHKGNKATHTRKGCDRCGTHKGCTVNEEHSKIKAELHLRQKALADDAFPDEELVSEFLQDRKGPENTTGVDLQWRMPDIIAFINFTRKHLQWEEIYSFTKFLPVLTRWIILNPAHNGLITQPDYIKKSRAPKGIASYEIIWKSDKFRGLIPKEQLEDTEEVQLFATIEPKHLVDVAFPILVAIYEESKLKPKAKAKKRTTKRQKTQKLIDKDTPGKIAAREDSLLGDELDLDLDMSLIVDEIVSQGVPNIFKRKINQLLAKESDVKEASFFDLQFDALGGDLFEQSLCLGIGNDEDSSESDQDE